MSDQPVEPQTISIDVERVLEQYDRHVAELTRRALFAENRLDSALRTLAAERDRFTAERQAMADADAERDPKPDDDGGLLDDERLAPHSLG